MDIEIEIIIMDTLYSTQKHVELLSLKNSGISLSQSQILELSFYHETAENFLLSKLKTEYYDLFQDFQKREISSSRFIENFFNNYIGHKEKIDVDLRSPEAILQLKIPKDFKKIEKLWISSTIMAIVERIGKQISEREFENRINSIHSDLKNQN